MYGNEKPGLVTTLVAVFGAALIGAVAAMILTGPVSGLQPVNQFAGPGSTADAYLPVPTVLMTVIGAAIGAIALRLILGALAGFDVGLVAAFAALVAGKIVFMTVAYAVPEAAAGVPLVGHTLSLAAVPQLFVAAVVVQLWANEPMRAVR